MRVPGCLRANLDYVDGLRDVVAWDRIRQFTVPLPRDHVRFAVRAQMGFGSTPGEAQPKPYQALDFEVATDTSIKVTASAVITKDLAKVSNGQRIVDDSLTSSVSISTDTPFRSFLVSGAPSISASGTAASNVIANVATGLSLMTVRGNSRLFLLVPVQMEEQLLLMPAGAGNAQAAFHDGMIGNVQIVGSDAMTMDSGGADVILLDASTLATFSGDIAVRVSEQAIIEMNSTPANPLDANTVYTSLWQSDLMAIQLERWISMAKIRPNAAVVIEGAQYSAAN